MKSYAVFQDKTPRHGAPVARLVAVSATAPPSIEQRERVAGEIKRLRALGSGAAVGCTLQQAIQAGRD